MAIVKHTTSKNMSYSDVLDYFSYKHKEEHGLYEPVLDEYGLMQERDNYAVSCLDPYGREAPPENWWTACMQTKLAFGKNQEKKDRKQHQYIISHPEEDRPLLTMVDLLEEGKAFVRENLPGYDALIPIQAEYLPAKGLEQLLSTVSKVKRQINPKLQIDGILLTMVDSRTNFAKDINALLRDTYPCRYLGKVGIHWLCGTQEKQEVRTADPVPRCDIPHHCPAGAAAISFAYR